MAVYCSGSLCEKVGGAVDKVRIGYVGCGMMAQRVHLPNFASLPDCELVALAEVRRDLGEKVQRRYGIPRLYPDHRGLIDDPQVDAIAVSAAFATQAEVARECLAAGKPVYMEKPMAISIAQAEGYAGGQPRQRRSPHGCLHEALRRG